MSNTKTSGPVEHFRLTFAYENFCRSANWPASIRAPAHLSTRTKRPYYKTPDRMGRNCEFTIQIVRLNFGNHNGKSTEDRHGRHRLYGPRAFKRILARKSIF